jgi:probable HAF family extracellular repeat protein
MGSTCAIRIFEGVGFVSGFTNSSTVTAMSQDGNVVIGYSEGATYAQRRAFKWSNGMLSPLTTATFSSTEAHGLNRTGSVIVGSSFSSTYNTNIATVWQGTTTTTRLGAVGNYTSTAYGTNDSGSIIVGEIQFDEDISLVRWVSGGAYVEAAMGAGISPSPEWVYVKAVSADASVVVGYCSDDPLGGYRWTAATGLLLLPNSDVAFGLTPDGAIAVGRSRDSRMAVKWTGMQNPVSLGIAGAGYAANADATLIVGSTAAGEAFIWDATHGARTLATVLTSVGADLTGWTLSDAKAISSDGKVIAGNGSHNGVSEGWIARLP